MDELDLSDLLTDVTFIPGVTEIEAKFKPKNVKLFIDRYQLLLEKMREEYDETYEESTIHYYENASGKIRETTINGKTTYDTKELIKNFTDYEDYGFIISINEEKKVENITQKMKKVYTRIRNRHKFDIGKYVLDMTEIKTKNNTIYEIELEFTGQRVNVSQFAKHILYFYKFIYNTEYMYNNDMVKRLVDQTNHIINPNNKGGKYIINLTPKARNLNFTDLTYGSIVANEVSDYYVGHKADGLYKKLVFNEDGIWLNNKDDYSLILLGDYDNSLYDCEVVFNNGAYKYYILVFDCLIHNKKFLYEMNLTKRTSYINNITTDVDNISILEKPWKLLTLENFFTTMKQMTLEQHSLDYPEDGFMFTFGKKYTFNSDKLPLYKRKLVDYPDLCKWKPYTKLTIDFRVVNDNGYVTLYVYNPKTNSEVPYIVPNLSQQLYDEKYNGYIVECIYDAICNTVIPVKIRYDKPGPNEMDIARSNWNNIIDPISIDDLCGNSLTLVTKYHNQIKNVLYGIKTIYPPLDFKINNYSLLDIGGGRGGDLSKWEKSGATNIITVEPNNQNLAELQRRLSKSPLKNKVTAINTVGEDTVKITKEVTKLVPNKIDVISLMLSLSFFFSDDEHLDALVQTIVHNLKQGGYVLFLTIDGDVLKKHLNLSLPELNVHYTLVDKIFVLAEIPGIVGKQWEFLVDLNKLTKKLQVYGIDIGEKRAATDELLLSKEAMLYSSLFSYGYYKKVKNVVPKSIVINLPKIVYPTVKESKIQVLNDDDIVPVRSLLYGNINRIGTLGSLEHAILKAVYEPYQNDTSNRLSMEGEFKMTTTKKLNTQKENDYIKGVSKFLNIDIYILSYNDDDFILKEHTYHCEVKNSIVLLINDNKYELIGIYVDGLLKTNFTGDEPFIYNIKKLIQEKVDNVNVGALINNMKKALVLPNKGTDAYNKLKDNITNVLEKNDIDGFNNILKSYKLLPETDNKQRINERVKSIDTMLKAITFNTNNMKVLDIGAGNGDIINALKHYYQLPKKNVYAIDQKLPDLKDVTSLTYTKKGTIPLEDNSINVILLYAVLHHIEPTIRNQVMKEIQRILAPGGIVIIREHDDDKSKEFYQYIDFIHILWYVTRDETQDPLYMLNRQEFTDMFEDIGLESIYYTSYDEPNTQHIYHEIFQKPIKKAETIIDFAKELITQYNSDQVLDMFGIKNLYDNLSDDVDYYGYYNGKKYKTPSNIHMIRGDVLESPLPDKYTLVLGNYTVNEEDDEWFDNLIDSMVKAWENLEEGGHMIIIAEDSKEYTFTQKMVTIFLKITTTATYMGDNNNYIIPAFVFKKVKYVDTSLLDIEVSRYNAINKMLLRATEGLDTNQQYEVKNILERWLLTLANDKEEGDKIFTSTKLKDNYNGTKKMFSELQDKKIPNYRKIYIDIISYAKEWLKITNYPKSQLPQILDNDTVKINDYIRILPPGKLDILLGINDDLVLLGRMIMRYACMLIGGQQWALPTEIYKYITENYKVTIEGFASPINSQILYVMNKEVNDLHFCSLFPDTDAIYGSIGSFFEYDFTDKHVYANPPYVDSLMNQVADKAIASCLNAKKKKGFVRFFITVPEWTDAEYYHKLKSSPYKVHEHSFPKYKHYYLDTNNGLTPVISKFGTHLFVLAVNVKDNYNEFITFAEEIYDKQIKKQTRK